MIQLNSFRHLTFLVIKLNFTLILHRLASDPYLVISFTEELEFLRFLVHENAIEFAGVDRTNLNSLVTPTHHVPRADVR